MNKLLIDLRYWLHIQIKSELDKLFENLGEGDKTSEAIACQVGETYLY